MLYAETRCQICQMYHRMLHKDKIVELKIYHLNKIFLKTEVKTQMDSYKS